MISDIVALFGSESAVSVNYPAIESASVNPYFSDIILAVLGLIFIKCLFLALTSRKRLTNHFFSYIGTVLSVSLGSFYFMSEIMGDPMGQTVSFFAFVLVGGFTVIHRGIGGEREESQRPFTRALVKKSGAKTIQDEIESSER